MIKTLGSTEQLKWAAEEKANKDAVNQGMDNYIKMLAADQPVPPGVVNQIKNDPRFNSNPRAREYLIELLAAHSGLPRTASYGPGYLPVMESLANNSSDMPDDNELLRRSLPSWKDDATRLTPVGLEAIRKQRAEMRKDYDQAGLVSTRTSLVKGAYDYVVIDHENVLDPQHPIKDKISEEAFNNKVLPAINSAYEGWRQKNQTGNPYDFWTHENIQKIVDTVWTPKDRADAKARSVFAAKPNEPPPPAPPDVDTGAWNNIVTKPPVDSRTNNAMSPQRWGQYLQALLNDEKPAYVAEFDRAFGPAGLVWKSVKERLQKRGGGNRGEITPSESPFGFQYQYGGPGGYLPPQASPANPGR
jgi:hypothetical protein